MKYHTKHFFMCCCLILEIANYIEIQLLQKHTEIIMKRFGTGEICRFVPFLNVFQFIFFSCKKLFSSVEDRLLI